MYEYILQDNVDNLQNSLNKALFAMVKTIPIFER